MKYLDDIERFFPECEQEATDKRTMLQHARCHPALTLTREDGVAHFTSSALIVNPQRTKLLLVHHNIMDCWAWVGGHMDGEQDFLAVALREVEEETGLHDVKVISSQIAGLDVLPVERHIKNGAFVGSHLHLSVAYLFEAQESALVRVKPDENTAIQWFDYSFVTEENFNPTDIQLYKKLLARAASL